MRWLRARHSQSSDVTAHNSSRLGQLLFAEPLGDGLVALDCLLEPMGGGHGIPTHLVVCLPQDRLMAAVERDLLCEWTAGVERVALAASDEPVGPRVCVRCASTTMFLRVVTAS